MDEITCHLLTAARLALGLTRVDLAREMRAAARRRGLRSGVDKARVRKWEVDGVVPDENSQSYIAEVLDVPASDVDTRNWPTGCPAWTAV